MIEAGSLEFALARMQARLSRRASEGTWAAIAEARTLTPIAEAVRGTPLGRLVELLPPQASLPDVDGAARSVWSRTVAEATAWMPPEWAPALAWCDAQAESQTPAMPNPTLLPSLAHPEWRRRWPRGSNQPELGELVRLFAAHLAQFRLAPEHEGSALRADFTSRLLALMRRHPVTAAAAFAWLALAALDLERLRGEIERRIAFPAARIAA